MLTNLILVPVYALAVGPARPLRRPVQRLYCRACLAASGLKLTVFGAPPSERPVLFVVNHVSYLDIPVLALVVDGSFVAKVEVARWPIYGFIGRLTRTVFVERRASEARGQRLQMAARLAVGDNLILFAEGTSTDGSGVAPFKSALFSIAAEPAEDTPVVVQPISIAYPRYADGTPLVGRWRDLYAWFGEATMLPHLVRMLGLRGAEVEVRFQPPLRPGDWRDRKDLARLAHAAVSVGVAASFSAALPAASAETRRSAPACR